MYSEEEIPASVLAKHYLEEQASALRERRPVPKEVLQFEYFLGKMFSDMLEILDSDISDEKFKEIAYKIYSFTVFAGNVVNALKQGFLELEKLYFGDPEQFKLHTFEERLKAAYETKKQTKSEFLKFDDIYAKIKQEPVSGLFKELYLLLSERRMLKRYLRVRFGIVRKSKRTIQKKSFRKKKEFYEWFQENYKDCRQQKTENIELAYRKYRFFLLHEQHLQNYADLRLSHLEAQLLVWKNSIFISFEQLFNLKNGIGFTANEFASKVLEIIEPV